MLRSIVSALAVFACIGGAAAHADSFKTEAHGGSKLAGRVGPAPYKGADFTSKQARAIRARGTALIARTKNIAVELDTVRVVDSATMGQPAVRGAFTRSLHQLAKTGGPAERFTYGYERLMRANTTPAIKAAMRDVRAGARILKTDSAVQLGAFQAIADAAYRVKIKDGNAQRRLFAEAGRYLTQAKRLDKAEHRPLVEHGLKLTEAYRKNYYPELTRFTK